MDLFGAEEVDVFQIVADLLDPPDAERWVPLPHQIPPAGKWFIWMLLGGRGAGKTATAARQLHEHVNGPPCIPDVPGGHWPSIIAPTLGDAVTSCVLGPSGLRVHEPAIKLRQTAGGTMVRWPNGCEAKLFGASTPEDVERLRSGGNRCYVWAEELAAWRYISEAWQHMRYGLRLGPWPRCIVSTTPKALTLIKQLAKQADEEKDKDAPYVVITRATTAENPHLNDRVKRDLFADYEGTRLGRQELLAEILEDVENALWTPSDIEEHRWYDLLDMPRFDRVVIGVDPAAKEGGNQHGIIAGARANSFYRPGINLPEFAHFFVLGDYSIDGRPEQWGRRVVEAYYDFEANYVVAETNNGGDMVVNTIHQVDDTIPIKQVHASRGKDRRAEPISALYQQGRGHHVGMFPELEDQMTTWDSIEPDPSWSPDRMDAMVWAATELMVGSGRVKMHQRKTSSILKNRR